MRLILCAGTLLLLVANPADSQPTTRSADEEALQKRAESFVATFNKGDAKALASFFTHDADIVDPEGRQIQGRKAIEETYTKLFDQTKGAKLFIRINAVRIAKPDLAFEDGTTEMVSPQAPPSAARYSVVYVKQDGQWYLASVREAIAVPPNNAGKMQDLAFLVGAWTEDSEKGGSARATYSWDSNQNFLHNTFDLTLRDISVAGGVQFIGWDESVKKPRGWSFLSNGGFAEAVWSKDGDGKWKIAVTGTQRDGSKVSGTNTFTKIDDDHFSIHLTDMKVDGKPVPDAPVVKMKRVK
jgi:uncharacterized protein (TIGR02246 family)